MKTKLTAGPTGRSCQLVDIETGDDLTKKLSITALRVAIVPDDLVRVDAELFVGEVEVRSGATRFLTRHPVTGEMEPLAALVFADGSRHDFA